MFSVPSTPFMDESDANIFNVNQLNRFPILPLSPPSAGASLTGSFASPPFSIDELNDGFAPHPLMQGRRFSSSSISSATSSELSIPPSYLQAMPPNPTEIELSPSPSPVDGPVTPTSISIPTSLLPGTPLNSPTLLQSPVDSSGNSGTQKRARAPPRERVSLKDFRPPDVTGLSKREARLVKNRAAAFLSRQRKREEFELMEIRVGELEKENARLRSHLSLSGRDASLTEAAFHSEMSAMRSQLASSEQRAAELRNEIMRLRSTQVSAFSAPQIKQEVMDIGFCRSPSPTSSDECSPDKERTATKLGLMVLMSLSSVLSKSSSAQWGFPARFSVSTDAAADAAYGDSVFPEPLRGAWDTFAGDALTGVAGAPEAEFDVAFAPSPDGRTHVTLSTASRQDPYAMPWASGPSSEFSFDMPTRMPDMSFDSFGGEDGMKRRLHVSMKNPSAGGDWDVEIL